MYNFYVPTKHKLNFTMTESLLSILIFVSLSFLFWHTFLMIYTLEEKCVVDLVLSEFQDEENCINNVTLEKLKG